MYRIYNTWPLSFLAKFWLWLLLKNEIFLFNCLKISPKICDTKVAVLIKIYNNNRIKFISMIDLEIRCVVNWDQSVTSRYLTPMLCFESPFPLKDTQFIFVVRILLKVFVFRPRLPTVSTTAALFIIYSKNYAAFLILIWFTIRV